MCGARRAELPSGSISSAHLAPAPAAPPPLPQCPALCSRRRAERQQPEVVAAGHGWAPLASQPAAATAPLHPARVGRDRPHGQQPQQPPPPIPHCHCGRLHRGPSRRRDPPRSPPTLPAPVLTTGLVFAPARLDSARPCSRLKRRGGAVAARPRRRRSRSPALLGSSALAVSLTPSTSAAEGPRGPGHLAIACP